MMRLIALLSIFFTIPLQANLRVVKAELAAGYRRDQLDWSIAGFENKPNILSELKWRDITSHEISGVLALACNAFYLRANGDYGRIFSGHNRDSDYYEDNRTAEFSRSRAQSDKGEVFDVSAGMGWQFSCGPLTLTPLVGWALDEQHFRDRKLFQILDVENPFFEGPVSGMHSNYRAKWNGPWVGTDLSFKAFCSLLLKGSFAYHWVDYDGTGHWNLRRVFDRDFEQKSEGFGIMSSFSLEYLQSDCLSWGLMGAYRKFTTHAGRDRKFFHLQLRSSEGNVFVIPWQIDTRLNAVHWKSYSLKLYVSYAF